MTVRELIQELAKYDGGRPVLVQEPSFVDPDYIDQGASWVPLRVRAGESEVRSIQDYRAADPFIYLEPLVCPDH